MSDCDIIALLTKIRERFKQLTHIYQTARQSGNDVHMLANAEQILATAMEQMQQLPPKPGEACVAEENRGYANQLLREISDLLQLTLVMDREARRTPAKAATIAPTPTGAARDRALRSYAR